MTTIAFRDSAANSVSGASTNKVIVLPSTVQSGDLMVLGWSATQSGGGNLPTAAPTGWTQIRTGTSNNAGGAAYWKIANSTDAGTTVTVPSTGATKASIVVGAYYNTDPTAPIAVSGVTLETATTATHAATALTTTSTGWIVRMLLMRDGATTSTSWTPPSGTTSRNVAQSIGTGNGSVAVLADTNGDAAAGGPSGSPYTGSWTVDQTSNSAVMIGFEIAAVGATTTLRPISDITTSGFTTVPSGLGLWQVTADDDPATYTVSPLGGGTERVRIDVAATVPSTLEVSGLAVSAATQSVQVKLYAGGTLVHAWAADTTLRTTEHLYSFDLTALSGGEITILTAGLSDLEVEIISAMT